MANVRNYVLGVAAASAIAMASGPAAAFPIFQVQEGSVPGALPNLVTADRIGFNYTAIINQTQPVNTPGGGAFSESGFLNKTAFNLGNNAAPSQLNGIAPTGYGIYGVFNITGTATPSGTGIHATFNTMTLSLVVDPNQDTTLGFSGNTATTGGNTGDDFTIINYTFVTGSADVRGGLNNGDFDTVQQVALTPAGQAYFVSPNPFYLFENLGGNTETINPPGSLTAPFVSTASGGGIELFANSPIPEPTALALLGTGLIGMGALSRRRRAK